MSKAFVLSHVICNFVFLTCPLSFIVPLLLKSPDTSSEPPGKRTQTHCDCYQTDMIYRNNGNPYTHLRVVASLVFCTHCHKLVSPFVSLWSSFCE